MYSELYLPWKFKGISLSELIQNLTYLFECWLELNVSELIQNLIYSFIKLVQKCWFYTFL